MGQRAAFACNCYVVVYLRIVDGGGGDYQKYVLSRDSRAGEGHGAVGEEGADTCRVEGDHGCKTDCSLESVGCG